MAAKHLRMGMMLIGEPSNFRQQRIFPGSKTCYILFSHTIHEFRHNYLTFLLDTSSNPIKVNRPFTMISSSAKIYPPNNCVEYLSSKKQSKGESTQITGVALSITDL